MLFLLASSPCRSRIVMVVNTAVDNLIANAFGRRRRRFDLYRNLICALYGSPLLLRNATFYALDGVVGTCPVEYHVHASRGRCFVIVIYWTQIV